MKVGLVGTGVIGTGWAVRALARGHSIVASDQADGAHDRLVAGIEKAWPAAIRLGVFAEADPTAVEWVGSAAEVAESADLVQESVPEDLDIKAAVHSELGSAAGPEVIIASSSSGLLPSKMQSELKHPGRFVVGHPFNPVYLLPLVEVVAGDSTSPETVDRAVEFYAGLGMHPLVVRNEIEGYLSDRLQEAVWREILHLVNDGVATTDELDQAIIYGPGLRWAGMGTNLTFYLAGGQGGIRHMLDQFGPALELPWTHLKAPALSEELIEAMARGTGDQAGERSVDELEQLRDDYLIAVMRALKSVDVGAGKILAEREAAILRTGAEEWQPGHDVPAPLHLYECVVEPDWVDYNGHMTESAFLVVAGWASDKLFRYIGVDESYRSSGASFYTAETHIKFKAEGHLNQRLVVETFLAGADAKRLHLVHSIIDAGDGSRLGSVEQMLLHVDTERGKVSPMPEHLAEAVSRIASTHAEFDPGVELTMEVP